MQERGACSQDSWYFLPGGVRFAFSSNSGRLPGPGPRAWIWEFCRVCAPASWCNTHGAGWECLGGWLLFPAGPWYFFLVKGSRVIGAERRVTGKLWNLFHPTLQNLWMSLSLIFDPKSKLCKFWRLYGGIHGDLLQEGLCHTQVCCTQGPAPAAGHCWRIPPQEILKHSPGSVSVQSLGPGVHKVWLSPPSISGRYGVWL